MSSRNLATRMPILLLHNLDPSWTDGETDAVVQEVARVESALKSSGYEVTNLPVCDSNLRRLLRAYDPDQFIVFNWCESLPGVPHSEDLAAKVLESAGFVYTGSPPKVIALSWDKARVKRRMERRRVPTPRWQVLESPDASGWDAYPAIVKPTYEHASLGLSSEAVVLDPEALCERAAYVIESFGQPALVEDFVDGREFHVSLWGNGTVEMLPPAEMDFQAFQDVRDRLCTYDAKFTPGSPHYDLIQLRLPAPLEEEELAGLEATARAAYNAIGCRDYGRLDIRLRDGVFYVLDVNPNADISPDASMACAAEVAGFTFEEMLSRLVDLAALRHPKGNGEGHEDPSAASL